MPYQEGDTSPPHVQVHNEVRAQVSDLADLMSVTVDLPPVVGLGDSGHVDHHNQFTTAINKIAAEGAGDPLQPAQLSGFAIKGGTPANNYAAFSTKQIGGQRVQVHTFTGDTTYQTRSLSEADIEAEATKRMVDTADVPTVRVISKDPCEFTFTVDKVGILIGAVIAAGGAGGVSGWGSYQPQGAPGGAGGVLLSSLNNPCVFLPFTGTWTVSVGSRCPGMLNYGLSLAQNTTLTHDATGYVITAVGGGSGGSAASASGYSFRAGTGGSAGAPLYDYVTSDPNSEPTKHMRGGWVPGQGHGAGRTEGYAPPGAGGAGGPGYDGGTIGTAVGGDGVDLFAAFTLDANDAQGQAWRNLFTDPENPGYVAGGGTGRKGTTSAPVPVSERSKGGGGMSTGTTDRDALNHTGSGGGAGAAGEVGGSGANGAVHIVMPI
jgi:hypothetical protein